VSFELSAEIAQKSLKRLEFLGVVTVFGASETVSGAVS
jgi:hypothetical protein